MLELFISATWAALVCRFVYSISKPFFGRKNIPSAPEDPKEGWPKVTVIVPARNEAENIEHCLSGLLYQDYPRDLLEVLVVDDHSTDLTPEIVTQMLEARQDWRLIDGEKLPKGWTGKNFACKQGADAAKGDYLCFIDADTVAKPGLIRAAASFAVRNHTGLLSLIPRETAVSFSERAILPSIFMIIAASMDFERVNDPDDPYALANGQFMFFSRDAYKKMGGHEAIRNEIMDDIAMARLAKESKISFRWLFGEKLVETRMYRGFGEIWGGFSKNMSEIMRKSSHLEVITTAMKSFILGWAAVLLPILFWPQAGFLCRGTAAFWLVAAGSGIFFLSHVMTVAALHVPVWYALFFPVGFSVHGLITLNSHFMKGKRKWKGRSYPAS